MSFQIKKSQKITVTIGGINTAGEAAPISDLAVSSSDESIAIIGAIDEAAGTAEIIGVADGTFSIAATATNVKGDTISGSDTGVIADPVVVDNVATTLGFSYGDPVDQ